MKNHPQLSLVLSLVLSCVMLVSQGCSSVGLFQTRSVDSEVLKGYYPSLAEHWDPAAARERLRNLTMIDGSAVGFSGAPGHFFALAKGFLSYPDEAMFLEMLESSVPVERAMGTLGLTLLFPDHDDKIRQHYDDREEVQYAPFGCSVVIGPIGEVIRALHENPEALGVERNDDVDGRSDCPG